jgi:GNAT superfamily N-acetyltransferase
MHPDLLRCPVADIDSSSPLTGWDQPIETSAGLVCWRRLAPPFGGRQIWYGMVRDEEVHRTLVGFLSVDDPSTVDEETRRTSDPTDLRIDTIWVHPELRGQGIGTAMQGLAGQARMFESHSMIRTEAGSRLAAAVDGADPGEVTEIPDAVTFDSGAHSAYAGLVRANPDYREYPITH